MSANIKRRISMLERTKRTAAPDLLLIVNRPGAENDGDIVGIDSDGTRLDRRNGESTNTLIDRAKAQIVSGGFHILRLIHETH